MQITCFLKTSGYKFYLWCAARVTVIIFLHYRYLRKLFVCVKMKQTLRVFSYKFPWASVKIFEYTCQLVSPADWRQRDVVTVPMVTVLCLWIQGAKPRNMRHSADYTFVIFSTKLSKGISDIRNVENISYHISLHGRSCKHNFKTVSKVKLSRYTPWRHMGGEEV
jgi:hypothetical protein